MLGGKKILKKRTEKLKRIYPLHLQIVITIILLIVIGSLSILVNKPETDSNLLMYLIWINNIAFLLQILLLKKILGSFLNPILLFSCFLFLFSSGQLILYSFNIEIQGYSIFERLNVNSIEQSILFIIIGYACYQLGVIFGIRKNNIYMMKAPKIDNHQRKAIFYVGITLFTIGILPYFMFLFNSFTIVLNQGYKAYYNEGVRLDSSLIGLSYFFLTGLVFIAVSGKKSQKIFSILVFFFIAAIRLISGDRGDGIIFIFTAYLLYIYFVNNKKNKLWVTIFILLLTMALVPVIAEFRHGVTPELTINEFIFGILKDNNVIKSTLENLGSTLFPLVKTMELVPEYQNYIFGGSYLTTFILLIPSPFRIGYLGNISNNAIYASPGNWLMKTLGMSYGPGYTPFAEAYLNLGWYGIVFLAIFGYIIAKTMSGKAKVETDIQMKQALGILTFTLIAMATRGSFNSILPFYFRYVLLPSILVKLVANGFKKNRNII